ncbi:hypothetical protein KBD69_00500 [Candidatus Woesebacteria bacterium]|nr:hypothetical protein [Candidatus Woesebacteria bacterium]
MKQKAKQKVNNIKVLRSNNISSKKNILIGLALLVVAINLIYFYVTPATPSVNQIRTLNGAGIVGSKAGTQVDSSSLTTTKTTLKDTVKPATNTVPERGTTTTQKSNPFEGASLNGGTKATEKPGFVEIITGFIKKPEEKQSLGVAPKAENATAEKPGRCMTDDCVVKPVDDNPFKDAFAGAGYDGEDKEGNKVSKNITTARNALGGETTTTVSTKEEVKTGNINQTRQIVVKDDKGTTVDDTTATLKRTKSENGEYVDETSLTRGGKVVLNTGRGATVTTPSNTSATNPSNPTNPNSYIPARQTEQTNKCKAGNVTVSSGTYVATGFNMGGDGNQRQCVQLDAKCGHINSRPCHEVYMENPAQVILPTGAGAEYTVGKPSSEVSPRETPKVLATCIANGETVPSGNAREEIGVCNDGKWIDKETYVAEQLNVFERNQEILSPTSFEFGQASGGLTASDQKGSGTEDRKSAMNRAKTYNTLNDKIYSGFSFSLAGRDVLTIGSQENRFLPIINFSPFKVKSEAEDWDNLYTGFNISIAGADFVIGKEAKDAPTYLDIDRPTLPKSFTSGIMGGATTCGPFIYPCAVLGAIIGGVNDLFTPDEPQSFGTDTQSPAQINDTGPSQINNVNATKTAGNTGGFNLSADANNIVESNVTSTHGNISYFNQKNYSGVTNPDGSNWGDVGCGIMSGAMVMSLVDPSITPEDYNALLEENGGVSAGGTSWFEQHKPILENQGFDVVPVAGSVVNIVSQINEYSKYGIPVWINSNIDQPNGDKGFGHQTLAVGTCPDGSCIILNDPYYGENYEMPVERFDVDCSNTCDGGRTKWVVNAVIPPAEAI